MITPAPVEYWLLVYALTSYQPDLTVQRLHHEIYLSDPRRTAPEKMRTVLRHPVRKEECAL